MLVARGVNCSHKAEPEDSTRSREDPAISVGALGSERLKFGLFWMDDIS
jgi:hypothetical protein